ncbi:dTDP-glucose 4,6-dehydratase [Sulfoacidibacillus ferrooxidans]|uniref:dTDP-glucose 4,6-dehydratase n=1 Tax=Sulfoacidibacillus ferrooxidans TaxID=2005001 RepID=A0A9X1V9M4_9BACL|nr:dTDP-glucose 4,6-dehydratase [Sulfoacidibacillus ferrooxidans]MCI0183424.1 dTDP-glucose 4,6-dehydratase 2 [Sulfoacidibacillus ferrooxidans]
MKIVVTGGAGFIGSNFVRMMVSEQSDVEVVTYDALTYAGNLANLAGIVDRHTFVRGDICDAQAVQQVMAGVDAVVHFAAESHVDRSIASSAEFVRTNVEGTRVLLEAARSAGVAKFVHVSTDEVYGTLGDEGAFTEMTPLAPNSPYSASKAGSDLLARAFYETYGLPVVITRCSNNYGPYQFPEKLIPLMIIHALEGRPLPVYGDGGNVRDWLHVSDHNRAIARVLEAGVPGQVYNIGGHNERTNLEMVRMILRLLARDESLITFVQDRLGHDRRYAMDATKIEHELGWTPQYDLERGLAETVAWYLEHKEWWERIRTGAYQTFDQPQSGARLGDAR